MMTPCLPRAFPPPPDKAVMWHLDQGLVLRPGEQGEDGGRGVTLGLLTSSGKYVASALESLGANQYSIKLTVKVISIIFNLQPSII